MDGKWKNIGDKNALLEKAIFDMMMRNSGIGSNARARRESQDTVRNATYETHYWTII